MQSFAELHNLELWKVKLPKPGTSYFGSCSKRGLVRIRIRWAHNGKRLPAYHIVDTMAHELAHLATQSHDVSWFESYVAILRDMTACGVFSKVRKLCKQ